MHIIKLLKNEVHIGSNKMENKRNIKENLKITKIKEFLKKMKYT